MYFSVEDRGKFSTMVYNWPHDGENKSNLLLDTIST